MNIFVEGWFHPKNKRGVELMNSELLKFDIMFDNNIKYDWIINLSEIKEYNLSYECGFIYGPQIMFPDIDISKLPKNKKYICNVLSKWMVDLCSNINPGVNFTNLPFAVDVDRFLPNIKIGKPVIYFKQRDPNILSDVLNKIGNDFIIFDYKNNNGYNEIDFLSAISQAPYCIWIGRHESQGFAFQETLSCNTPIFVIDVRSKRDEYVNNSFWHTYLPGHSLTATSASYFDDRCGLICYPEDWKENINLFISELSNYTPRKFIIENLSPNACINTWTKILNKNIK